MLELNTIDISRDQMCNPEIDKGEVSYMTGNLPMQSRNPVGQSEFVKGWGVNSEYGVLRDVLLGSPEAFRWVHEHTPYNSVVRATQRAGSQFDSSLAQRQYNEMVNAYESAGVTVHTLPFDEATPFQVFARDSSVMTPYGAVVCQIANPRRRGEYSGCLRFYSSMGIPIYDLISAGNFEGGDFNIVSPGCVLIGHTGLRSENVAAYQIGGWLEREGWEVKYTAIDEYFVHIDVLVCMLADKLAAVCVEAIDPEIVRWLKAKQIEILDVGFRDCMTMACNLVSLGNDRILSTLSNSAVNNKLRAMGFEVYDPDMTMFTLAGGGVHCMCQGLKRDIV